MFAILINEFNPYETDYIQAENHLWNCARPNDIVTLANA